MNVIPSYLSQDNIPLEIRLKMEQVNLRKAEIALKAAQNHVTAAEVRVDRAQGLVVDNAISQAAVDDDVMNYKSAELEVEMAKCDVELAQVKVDHLNSRYLAGNTPVTTTFTENSIEDKTE